MKTRTRLGAWIGTLALLLAAGFAGTAYAASVTWDGSGDMNWGPPPDSTSWSGGTYNDLDTALFAGAGTGTVTIDAGGVIPLAVNVTAGSYTFAGGNITGSGALTNSGSGTLTVGTTYDGLRYTGDTQLDSGTLQIRYSNNNGGGPSQTDRSFGGTTVLSGGTLQFNHQGAGHNNPHLTFTNGITVDADGGAIDFAGSANAFYNTLGAPTLGGPLTVTGVTGNPSGNGSPYNFTSGTLTLTADAAITNNTTKPAGAAHAVVLSPDISGSSYTLSLATAGTGGGFYIAPTSTSLNLANLVVGTNSQLHFDLSGNNVNPLSQIKANSGTLTMQTGSSLTYRPLIDWWDYDGAVFDTSAVVWQGGNTLNLAKGTQGNGDTYHTVTGGNLVVSTAAGLTQLNAIPWRGYLTIASPYVLTVGDGGTLQWTAGSQVQETIRGNMTMLNGATIVGVNSSGNPGGIIRDTTGGGTLTLGDGSAAVVTVQGNHATDTDSFNLGWPAANVTDNGNVAMRYANTGSGAGDFFNVGWSAGASYNAALVAFKETSGGTEFAPLAGSGGVAIVGPSSGTVASFSNAVTVSGGGPVGFHNETNTNQRGVLGPVVVAANNSLGFTTNGVLRAGELTFGSGAEWGLALYSNDPAEAGRLDVSGSLTFSSDTRLVVDQSPTVTTKGGPWAVATFGSLNGIPRARGYSLWVEGNSLMLSVKPSGGVLVIR